MLHLSDRLNFAFNGKTNLLEKSASEKNLGDAEMKRKNGSYNKTKKRALEVLEDKTWMDVPAFARKVGIRPVRRTYTYLIASRKASDRCDGFTCHSINFFWIRSPKKDWKMTG